MRREPDRARRRVEPTDWKRIPMQPGWISLPCEQLYSLEQFEALKMGIYPRAMEEKWFIYWQEPWLRMHRSWTGLEVYALRFEMDFEGARAVELRVNGDPKVFQPEPETDNVEEVTVMLGVLFGGVPFEIETTEEALAAWAKLGSASLEGHAELGVMSSEIGAFVGDEPYAARQPWDPFVGAMLGLACGDALGAPVEFKKKAWISDKYFVLDRMVGGGQCGWEPGEWTDDTGMALCVAEGILEAPDDPVAGIGERFLEWRKTAKDVGGTISAALSNFRGDWAEASRTTPQARSGKAAGNGSLMRTLPVALAYPDQRTMERQSARISAMTHWDPQAEMGCAVYCEFARQLLGRVDLKLAWNLAVRYGMHLQQGGQSHPGTPGPRGVPQEFLPRLNDARHVDIDRLQPTGYAGYVLDCLEAAVRMIFGWPSLSAAIVQTVNLGGESDTMAAVCGGAAGAMYGPSDLNSDWLDKLFERERIERVGRELYELRHRLIYAKPGLPAFTFSRVDDTVMAGRNPLSHRDVETLRAEGVTEVLDLREREEWTDPKKFGADARAALSWCHMGPWELPITDTTPPSLSDLDRASEILSNDREGTIYVHCRAGQERTAAILTAWLARKEGLGYDEALARLRQRGYFKPLRGQERVVRAWLKARS